MIYENVKTMSSKVKTMTFVSQFLLNDYDFNSYFHTTFICKKKKNVSHNFDFLIVSTIYFNIIAVSLIIMT